MAQIFKRSANSYAAISLMVLAVLPFVLIPAGSGFSRSSYVTKVNVPLNQPVPFSHQHHAWELGIDCRYCHTSVETSFFAGIPSTETCMSCHSQIWTNSPLLEPVRRSYETGQPIEWNRVNKLPEFVFFNHSIHVARGINCNVCHGPVQFMQITWKGNPFQMSWCLDCHRAPERMMYTSDHAAEHGLSLREQVFNLYWRYQRDGNAGMSGRERAIIAGRGTDYNPSREEVEEGRRLVELYGVRVPQLADCNICHR
jgi:hypothetical protein